MSDASTGTPAVYVQTNDQTKNEVLAFERQADGRLAAAGRFETGGRGTGEPHLASQSSLALSDNGAWLLVVNAGSDELSLFAVRDEAITRDGRYLYAIDTDAQRVFGWSVTDAGELVPVGAFEGVPHTVAGLAAS